MVALVVGLAIARGAWAMTRRRRRTARHDPEVAPSLAATEVVALGVVVTLGVWVLVWIATLVA